MKNKPSRLRAWLNNIPIQDRINYQMASLLQVMLIGLIAIIIIATIINLFLTPTPFSWQVVITQNLVISLIFGIPLFLLRRGYFRGSVFFIITLLLILITTAVLRSNLRTIAENLTFSRSQFS